MAETIRWNFVTQVLNGPNVSAAGTTDTVDAYDKFNIRIEDSQSQAVSLVPPGAGITLLVINPVTPDETLSYELDGNPVALDGPHVLLGSGAVGLLGGVTSLTFTNNTGADAVIEILVGRDSTP
ncbi:MAG: hypothetical protein H6985_08870 [Pseudomonadales bacterium]|nr:hypothetical protein [Halioglobus sp.]MCP5129677.1 hypothetical protein [Pseudomonadales bacterium]